ncbi:DUF6776 family protein [Aestuariibacter salexigens]|uniref:DUF6776 family protein n=1 Tax=Aestuariibacter salexigens TaxID=226010 RepID=UPI00041962FB|nr:DUF6776 family protein [Aestuariibacter salexigens]
MAEKASRPLSYYVVLVGVMAICTYLGYALGSLHEARQQTRINTLQHTVDNLRQENDTLTRDLNVLGVELEVQKLAVTQTQQQLEAQQQQQEAVQRELAFYQRVMAPELTQEGFVIEGLQFTPTSLPRHYRFELVLLQQDQIKSVINGTLQIVVEGSQNGAPVRFRLSELLLPESADIDRFSFKYFQLIDGVVSLPEGFVPEQITVNTEIYQFRRKRGELSRTFMWGDIQNT